MNSPNTSSNLDSPKSSELAKSKSSKTKASTDRHLKVDGRDRRVRLPLGCAKRVFELNKKLGHRTAGQTVEWLLTQAQSSVEAVLTSNAMINPLGLLASYPSIYRPPMVSSAGIFFPVLEGDCEVSSTMAPMPKPTSESSKCELQNDAEDSADAFAEILFQPSQ